MYKRRARVVFVAHDGSLIQRALRCAQAFANDWIEAQAYTPALSDCDLLVTLDAEGLRDLPPLPPGARHKHWPLSARVDQDLEAHMKGLIGGMRLLASLDGGATPPH